MITQIPVMNTEQLRQALTTASEDKPHSSQSIRAGLATIFLRGNQLPSKGAQRFIPILLMVFCDSFV